MNAGVGSIKHKTPTSPPDLPKEAAAKPQTWQERLIAERDALDEKLTKLLIFLQTEEFQKLDSNDRYLLEQQTHPMKAYLDVLNARIERAGV